MIQDPDVHQSQSLLQSMGDALVGFTGISNPRGMIMGQNQGGSVTGEGSFNHFTRVNTGPVDGTLE